MVYFYHKELLHKKSLVFSFLIFFGLGLNSCFFLYQKLGFSQRFCKSILDLDSKFISFLENFINSNFLIELELRKTISKNLFFLKSIKSYRGFRHLKKLPSRGQRTRSNARTCKRVIFKFSFLKQK